MSNRLVLPSPSIDIIPSPVIVFTQIDAQRAVAKAPIILMPDYENVAAVIAVTTPPILMEKCCLFIVTHHAKSKRTGKTRVMGSWQIKLPLQPTEEMHVFRLAWPTEEAAPINGHDVTSPA